MIHFNDPEYNEQRINVKPLTLEEEKEAIKTINHFMAALEEDHGWVLTEETELIQRLIWNYENLCHFKSVNSDRLIDPSVCAGENYKG